jgi:hypothetical protein
MSQVKNGTSMPGKPARRPAIGSAVDVAGYRIDIIHPERHSRMGLRPTLVNVASLGVGYLLVLAATTRALAFYLGWGPTLLLFGAVHLCFAFMGLFPMVREATGEARTSGAPGWHLVEDDVASSRRTAVSPPPSIVPPPTFPPRTRNVP